EGVSLNFKDAPPLLVLLGMPFIKHNAVAWLERQSRLSGVCGPMLYVEFDNDIRWRHRDNGANPDAAVLGEQSLHEPLMVDAIQKSVRESARKTLGQVQFLLMRQHKR